MPRLTHNNSPLWLLQMQWGRVHELRREGYPIHEIVEITGFKLHFVLQLLEMAKPKKFKKRK